MKTFFVLVLALFSAPTWGVQSSSVPAIGFGQSGTNGPAPMMYLSPYQLTGTAESSIFTLSTGNVAAALGNQTWFHIYKNGVEYFVPTGTTTHCFNTVVSGNSGTGTQIGMAASEFTNGGASTLPTGSKYQCGAPANYCMNALGNLSPQPGGIDFVGPTYPAFIVAGVLAASLNLQCFEK